MHDLLMPRQKGAQVWSTEAEGNVVVNLLWVQLVACGQCRVELNLAILLLLLLLRILLSSLLPLQLCHLSRDKAQ